VSVRRALEQGFTTLRDVETEGSGYGDVEIKQAIEAAYVPGPRLFVSTRAISTTGGYPLEGYAPELDMPKGAQLIDGPVEARKAAREQLDRGADWIKVYMTHRSWIGRNGELVSQPTLTVEELKAVVDETHGWGKKVACHAHGGARHVAHECHQERYLSSGGHARHVRPDRSNSAGSLRRCDSGRWRSSTGY